MTALGFFDDYGAGVISHSRVSFPFLSLSLTIENYLLTQKYY